ARYYEAHDVVWDLKQRQEYLAQGVVTVQQQTLESTREALRLDQSLAIVEDSLGLSDGKNQSEADAEFSGEVSGVFADLEEHNLVVLALYAQIDEMTQRYNDEIDRI